jgi:type I restriction enzyme S subunit
LGDVTEIASGLTLGRNLNGRKNRLVPYLRVANVKDGYLDLREVKETPATEDEIRTCRLEPGDVLLTEGGDIDKLGRGTFWQGELSECLHQNHIFRVRSDSARFDPAFLAYQFGSPYGKSYFLRHGKQTTGIASINKTVLSNFPLIVAPIAEQRRIARRLASELQAVASLRSAVSNQRRDVASLYARVQKDIGAELAAFPKAPLKTLIARIETGRSIQTTELPARDDQLGVLKVSAVSWGEFRPREAKAVEPNYQPEDHHRVCKGDVLMSRANTVELVGAVVRVDRDYPNRLLSDKTLRLILDENRCDPAYIVQVLRLPEARAHIENNATGTSNSMRNISQDTIRATPIPLPSLSEQRRFAARLSAVECETTKLVLAIQRQVEELELIPQKLLAHVFDC